MIPSTFGRYRNGTRFVIPMLLLTACAGRPHGGNETSPTASSIEIAVERAAGSTTLWPGFESIAVPLAIFDGRRTYLFRHPSPPEGFVPAEGTEPARSVYEGRFPAVTANSSADVGGVATATLMLIDSSRTRSVVDLAAIAIHEAFHVYTREHHPAWQANEADLFLYPIDDAHLLALRRLETEALRRALGAADEAGSACFAREALERRRERYAAMEPAFAAYERGNELNEGLATYVEARAAGRTAVDLPIHGFEPAEVRRRSYATGPALALLLDRLSPGWPASFEKDDTQHLDTALEAALGPPPGEGTARCRFSSSDVAEAERIASGDVALLVQRRSERRAEFDERPGWRIVVRAADGQPLWPKGFDPLNVERVDGGVLHSRYLRLGNDAGQLEAIDGSDADIEAFTEGVGPHPLFNGIRQVVLSGPAEPVATADGDHVSVHSAGITADFRNARLSRNGQEVVVQLEPKD